MAKFKVLEMGDIEEGRFLGNVNLDLEELQAKLIEHVRQYGREATKGAKAKLQIEVSLSFEGRDNTDYSIKATTKRVLPGRPASVTVGIADEKENGDPTLFVRQSGSTDDTPKQGVLATRDGRTIDITTGKPKE